jgi:hypothetical protein
LFIFYCLFDIWHGGQTTKVKRVKSKQANIGGRLAHWPPYPPCQ